MENEFEGVFKFTNATDEDFVFFWNNKEYIFPSNTSCPMILANETLENIQEIRKKAAYKLAVREFYKGKEYKNMSKMGNGLPPTFDDKILEPWINQCLVPLPKAIAKVKEGKKDDDKNYRATRAVGQKSGQALSEEFKEYDVESIGEQPNTVPTFN